MKPLLGSLPLTGLFLLLQSISSLAQAPTNDNFANATVISGDPAVGTLNSAGTNVNATKEAGEPNHAGVPGGSSIWFRWTAPASRTVAIDLTGSRRTDNSTLDTIIGVYLGAAVGSLQSLVAANDDGDYAVGAVGVPSKVVFNAIAGLTYEIAVDGFPDADNLVPTGSIALSIASVTPPANDSFDSPFDLGSSPTAIRSGDTHLNSTIEAGESVNFHGQNSFGTTWYTWTAPKDGASSIQLSNGTARPSLVVVYIGDSLGSLTRVASGVSGSETLLSTSAGTTYRIAIVGVYTLGAQTRGEITLNFGKADARPIPSFDFGESWQWLHPQDGVDPAVADTDFNTTWFNPAAGYDGPTFSAAAPSLLGYGAINAATINTNIGEPASGNRYSAYFFRNFTLDTAIDQAVVELLADDGAVIYVDGAEAGRDNFTGADTFVAPADGSANREDRTFKVAIGRLEAGPHTIGVSVHNATSTSSDLGFDLRLLEGVSFLGNVSLDRELLCAGFQDTPAGTSLYVGQTNGSELGWVGSGGMTIAAAGDELAFEFTNTNAARLETERVNVSGRQGLIASIDMRALDSSSGFELGDFLHIYLEGSTDGLTFQPVADIFSRLTGGAPDPFEVYRSETDYTSFTTQLGDIPDGLLSVRFVVEATVDSDSEHLIVDNLCLLSGSQPIKLLSYTADTATGASLTIQAEPGHLYELQSSNDIGLSDAWSPVGLAELAESETLTLSAAGPLATTQLFFRVVDLGED